MSYVGNTPTQQAFTPAVDYFNGTGSQTAFTLSRPVASVAQVEVIVNNVPQNPGSTYTVSSNTITFVAAPSAGTNNVYVRYTSPITQVIQPGQGTVGNTQMATGAALANIGAGGVTSTYLASGAARANFGAGGVLQVIQTVYNTTTSTTSTSFVTTGLTGTITPTSSTNKILLFATYPVFNTGTSTYASFHTLFRGTTSGTNLGHASNGFGVFGINSTAQNLSGIVNMNYLDSPATTSAQTYTVAFRSENATNTVTVCRIGETATLTLMEIAA